MGRPRNFQDILSKLADPVQSEDNWKASCPVSGHQTPEGHLSLKDGGDKALVTCQGGRHSYEDICKALGYSSLTYSGDVGEKELNIGKTCYCDTPPSDGVQKTITPAVSPYVTGVTIKALVEVKRLQEDFLRSLGIADVKYHGQPAVRIPYYSEDGQEVAVRFRLTLSGNCRFKWRKGDHALPYGLNRLEKIREAGWVLIVEGESDCWTAWFRGIPALGAPGKGIWPSDWGEYLEGLEVFIWQEPEAADFVLRVLRSIPTARYIPAPEGMKDISEAHKQGYNVQVLLEELKAKAEAGEALKARCDDKLLAQLYNEAKMVIEAEDPLELIKSAIRGLGYGGDLKPALVAYLAATSRLLAMRDGSMPVHLLLSGVTSIGKTYTLSTVMKLLPAEALHTVDAGSPRTIIYDDTDFQHRLLIFREADSLPAGEDNPAASAVRNLLQDHYLHYEVTVRDPITGDYTVRDVNKVGPTVLITTSAHPLGAQLMSRLFNLEISDNKEQIKAALETQAILETKGIMPVDKRLVYFQIYLQRKVPWHVVVPFACELAAAIAQNAAAPRVLRDYQRLLSMIKSVTILRYRQRKTDDQGRLVATLADYKSVRELVNDMYVDSCGGAGTLTRAFVEAVITLNSNRIEGQRITIKKVADYLQISKMAASRRARRAIKEDWLINRESRKGYPADLAPGESMPAIEGLPELNGVTDNKGIPVVDFSLETGDCNTVTPLTDCSIPNSSNEAGNLPEYPNEPCPKCGGEWAVSPDGRYICENAECRFPYTRHE